MHRIACRALACLALAALALGGFGQSAAAPAPPPRIVFLGDSITDGHTYPMLVRQALADAGLAPPACINAGIGGDTAAGMRKRLDRDVLIHKPALVTLSVGINDALRKVPPAAYEADLTAICERLLAEKIPVLLLTTSLLGPKNADADKRLADYNVILRRLAAIHVSRLAEVNLLMEEARTAGTNLLDTDGVHPNFAGHRVMARAILDALGYKEVPVPPELKIEVMPGIIRQWKIRVAPRPLDEAAVAALKPDAAWKDYTLPETAPQTTWWLEQERRRGFALSLDKLIAPGGRYQGLAVIDAPAPRRAFLNPGAQVEAVWLNGRRLYKRAEWTGWHAGRERLPADLQKGPNAVVIEMGPQFFLSMTADNTW